MVNLEVLSSKIVGIQELGVAFSLIFIIYLKSPYGESDQCTILQQEARETLVNKNAVYDFALL